MLKIRILVDKLSIGFLSLKGSPRELWCAYTIKFLESIAYFSFSLIFTLFLSDNFGYTDIQAGMLYGGWGALTTAYGLVTGLVIDNIGVSWSIKIGLSLTLLGRILIFATTTRALLMLSVLCILPIGMCFIIPVLTVGIRRYTNKSNSSFAFGLFYVVMNVAALVSGPIVDLSKNVFGDDNVVVEYDPTATWSLTGYRLIVLLGIFANVFALFISIFIREINVDNSHTEEQKLTSATTRPLASDDVTSTPRVEEFCPKRGNAKEILSDVLYSSIFWKFMAVCIITVFIRMIFRHLDATLPKYMIREFGENVPFGTIYAINPALIIILVPIMTALFKNVDPLIMIHHGCYVSAFSVFFLAFSTSITACVFFVVTLSIGEAMWSPRFYDYCMSVVQEGREGTYIALSTAPLFLVKLPVGFMSGYLLQKYCPEEGERDSKMMWWIIGLTTIPSPILLTVFWNYIYIPSTATTTTTSESSTSKEDNTNKEGLSLSGSEVEIL